MKRMQRGNSLIMMLKWKDKAWNNSTTKDINTYKNMNMCIFVCVNVWAHWCEVYLVHQTCTRLYAIWNNILKNISINLSRSYIPWGSESINVSVFESRWNSYTFLVRYYMTTYEKSHVLREHYAYLRERYIHFLGKYWFIIPWPFHIQKFHAC